VHPEDTARKSSGMTAEMWHTVFAGVVAVGIVWGLYLAVRWKQRKLAERLAAELAGGGLEE
jgi:hypothetical protein